MWKAEGSATGLPICRHPRLCDQFTRLAGLPRIAAIRSIEVLLALLRKQTTALARRARAEVERSCYVSKA